MADLERNLGLARALAEDRLAGALGRDDSRAEAIALVDLVEITYAQRDTWQMITFAERAWALAEDRGFFDQLARLALQFGDIAYSGEDYLRSYDHYANACAYAAVTGAAELAAVVERLDGVIGRMLEEGKAPVAVAFCEMLLAYEAEGGLAGSRPAFVSHFQGRLELARAGLWSSPALVGARLN